MGVDLAIVSLLDTEHEIDSATFQDVIRDAKVPCCHLETMEEIIGNFLWFLLLDFWVHDIDDLSHFPDVIPSQLHKVLLEEHLLVKKLLLSCQLLQTLWNPLVAITDDTHEEVVFRELVLVVKLHAVVVVQQTLQRCLQLFLILVVHGDTDGQFGWRLSDTAPSLDFGEHTCALNLSVLGIRPETSWPDLAVQRGICEDHSLIGDIDRGLPGCLRDLRIHRCVLRLSSDEALRRCWSKMLLVRLVWLFLAVGQLAGAVWRWVDEAFVSILVIKVVSKPGLFGDRCRC